MFDCLRRAVAGPKNRLVTPAYDLDLTYITPALIAMAFPASGLEQLYRNCIADVAALLRERHEGRYLVFNLSNRSYDTAPFEGRVREYEWEDHQAPCLTTLFEIAEEAARHLRTHPQAVVAFHCNHGKGRTGTAAMSLLLYLQDFASEEEVLAYYNERRFSTKKYVVSQPCQLRYLRFYRALLTRPEQYPHLKAYRLTRVSQEGLRGAHYLRVSQVRSGHCVYARAREGEQGEGGFVMGDVFMEVMREGVLADSRISRINYHMQFGEGREGGWRVRLEGDSLTLESCVSPNFTLTLEFELYCQCHLREKWSAECECFRVREKEEWHWSRMHSTIRGRGRGQGQGESEQALWV